MVAIYRQSLSGFEVHAALAQVLDFATACNTFIESTAPWKLAKQPEEAAKLDGVLYALAESLRILAILISPVLPQAARGIFSQLNWEKDFALADAHWGGLPDGHTVNKPTPLFPRIETNAA